MLRISVKLQEFKKDMAPGANLRPVSLIPVVQFDLRIYPRIFRKIRNDPIVIYRGLGEDDS